MNIIYGIIERIKRRHMEAARIDKLQEAGRRLQVREFGDRLCLAFDGIPILPMADFDNSLLTNARQTFLDYITDKNNINKHLKSE